MPTVQSANKEMLTTKETANLLGVSAKTIYRMEDKGLIKAIRTPGGQRRFTKSNIRSYIIKSQEFVAPQNPSKFLVRDEATRTLFDIDSLSQETPSRTRIDQLEKRISFGTSSHRQHYDEQVNPKRWVEEWDFKTYKTKIYTHGFHNYPAMFIPQVARKLILAFSEEGDLVCDIFCGSGTTLVESSLLNRNSIGIELNPLAVLITRAKTMPIDPKTLTVKLKSIIDDYKSIKNIELPDFYNIEFWFNKKVIRDLAYLRQAIRNISEEDIRNFFLVCFSEVVRLSP